MGGQNARAGRSIGDRLRIGLHGRHGARAGELQAGPVCARAVVRDNSGTAPPEDTICYSFAAGAGQTARLRVTGNNMIISVIGVGDGRDSWTFTTKAQTYKFIVGQLMRSVTLEPYTVTLSIK
jgi:hypothetical protein